MEKTSERGKTADGKQGLYAVIKKMVRQNINLFTGKLMQKQKSEKPDDAAVAYPRRM